MSRPTGPIKFTVQDRWGDEHEYTYVLHPGAEGMPIVSRLADMAGGAVVSGDIAAITSQLAGTSGQQLIRDLLRHTSRDGHQLGQDRHFSSAYAGNYGEMIEAVGEVLAGNGFLPPLDSLQRAAQRALPEAKIPDLAAAFSDSAPALHDNGLASTG